MKKLRPLLSISVLTVVYEVGLVFFKFQLFLLTKVLREGNLFAKKYLLLQIRLQVVPNYPKVTESEKHNKKIPTYLNYLDFRSTFQFDEKNQS